MFVVETGKNYDNSKFDIFLCVADNDDEDADTEQDTEQDPDDADEEEDEEVLEPQDSPQEQQQRQQQKLQRPQQVRPIQGQGQPHQERTYERALKSADSNNNYKQ